MQSIDNLSSYQVRGHSASNKFPLQVRVPKMHRREQNIPRDDRRSSSDVAGDAGAVPRPNTLGSENWGSL